MNKTIRTTVALALAGATSVLAACGLQPASGYAPPVEPGIIQPIEGAGDVHVVVGSKNFTEQLILGKIAVMSLRAAGFDITDATNLPGSMSAREAQVSGNTNMQWEYTGTAWVSYMGQQGIPDQQEQWQAVYDADLENGLTWLPAAPMNNTYGFAMGRAAADKFNISTMSEIASLDVAERTFCLETEFRSRDDGFEPWLEHYDMPLDSPDGVPADNIRIMDTGAIYQATATDECNFGEIFTTDGRILALDLTLLEDDLGYFPSYNVAPYITTEIVEEFPRIAEVFDLITPLLTDEALIDLNARVDVDGEEPADVARDWLLEQGLVTLPD